MIQIPFFIKNKAKLRAEGAVISNIGDEILYGYYIPTTTALTFTCYGIGYAQVLVVGAGQAGGGSNITGYAGNGGSGGQVKYQPKVLLTPGVYSIYVGYGGIHDSSGSPAAEGPYGQNIGIDNGSSAIFFNASSGWGGYEWSCNGEGAVATNAQGGNGGSSPITGQEGTTCSITGTAIVYGSGGGGGKFGAGSGALGGSGAGNGGNYGSNGSNGVNYGSGGGGAGQFTQVKYGGDGKCGCVYIRFLPI